MNRPVRASASFSTPPPLRRRSRTTPSTFLASKSFRSLRTSSVALLNRRRLAVGRVHVGVERRQVDDADAVRLAVGLLALLDDFRAGLLRLQLDVLAGQVEDHRLDLADRDHLQLHLGALGAADQLDHVAQLHVDDVHELAVALGDGDDLVLGLEAAVLGRGAAGDDLGHDGVCRSPSAARRRCRRGAAAWRSRNRRASPATCRWNADRRWSSGRSGTASADRCCRAASSVSPGLIALQHLFLGLGVGQRLAFFLGLGFVGGLSWFPDCSRPWSRSFEQQIELDALAPAFAELFVGGA